MYNHMTLNKTYRMITHPFGLNNLFIWCSLIIKSLLLHANIIHIFFLSHPGMRQIKTGASLGKRKQFHVHHEIRLIDLAALRATGRNKQHDFD